MGRKKKDFKSIKDPALRLITMNNDEYEFALPRYNEIEIARALGMLEARGEYTGKQVLFKNELKKRRIGREKKEHYEKWNIKYIVAWNEIRCAAGKISQNEYYDSLDEIRCRSAKIHIKTK